MFEVLLGHKADPNIQCYDAPFHRLSAAPGPDGKELILLLLKHGADPNLGLKKADNRTPLESAVGSADSTREIAELLLSAGAKFTPRLGPRVASSGHRTALSWVDFLADHGYDLNQVDNRHGGTLLMIAIKNGNIQTARALLKRGSDPRVRWKWPDYLIPIDVSVLHTLPSTDPGAVQALELLLPYGLDINARSPQGVTPLLSLRSTPLQPKTISLLLKAGADIHAVDQNGRGIVHQLAKSSPVTIEALRIVTNEGADINLQDRFGNVPVMSAVRWSAPALVEEFINLGANLHVQNQHGFTPLHVAAYRGSARIVSLLLEHGAEKNTMSKMEERPCEIASLGRFVITGERKEVRGLLCPPDRANLLEQPPLKNQAERQELDRRNARFFNIF